MFGEQTIRYVTLTGPSEGVHEPRKAVIMRLSTQGRAVVAYTGTASSKVIANRAMLDVMRARRGRRSDFSSSAMA